MAVELNVVVDIDSCRLETGNGHACGWQGFEGGLVHTGKRTGAAIRQFLERALVQVLQQSASRFVQRAKTEESLVAQPRQNPAFHYLYCHFHLGLVTGFSRARRQHGPPVVLREFFEQTMIGGLVAVWTDNKRTWLVGHQQARHAADEFQGINNAGHPVSSLLGGRGAGVSEVGCTQHGHKHLCLRNLATAGIHYRHSLPGVVHEEFVTRLMGRAHRAS